MELLGSNILKPTAADIVTCFGEPDLYQAIFTIDGGGLHSYLGLWYLADGVVIYSEQLYGYIDQLPSSMDIITMTSMSLTAPGTAESMIRDLYDNSDGTVLATLRPWPGTWEVVEFTGCFDIRDCPYGDE